MYGYVQWYLRYYFTIFMFICVKKGNIIAAFVDK